MGFPPHCRQGWAGHQGQGECGHSQLDQQPQPSGEESCGDYLNTDIAVICIKGKIKGVSLLKLLCKTQHVFNLGLGAELSQYSVQASDCPELPG